MVGYKQPARQLIANTQTDPRCAVAYRIQGPTLLIEFSNEQDDSEKNMHNHVHSVWRNPKGDYGLKDD